MLPGLRRMLPAIVTKIKEEIMRLMVLQHPNPPTLFYLGGKHILAFYTMCYVCGQYFDLDEGRNVYSLGKPNVVNV